MEYSTAQNRRHILNRSLQMLLFGLLMNLGLTIIGFLAFFQFFWLLISKEKNLFLSLIHISEPTRPERIADGVVLV